MTKNKLRKLSLAVITLTSTLILLNVFLFVQNFNLKAKIDNTDQLIEKIHKLNTQQNPDHLQNILLETQFKENLVLNQFSNNTAIILGVITFIAALGVFISFKSFDDKIKKVNNNHKKTKNELIQSIEYKTNILKDTISEKTSELKHTIYIDLIKQKALLNKIARNEVISLSRTTIDKSNFNSFFVKQIKYIQHTQELIDEAISLSKNDHTRELIETTDHYNPIKNMNKTSSTLNHIFNNTKFSDIPNEEIDRILKTLNKNILNDKEQSIILRKQLINHYENIKNDNLKAT